MKPRNGYFQLLILLLTFLLPINSGYAQCCSAGSPLGASSYGGIVDTHSIRLSSFIRYSQSDDYYSKSTIQKDYGLLSYADFLFQGLSIAYGIANKVNVEAELGYFYRKAQYFKFDSLTPQTIYKGTGLSNTILSVKYAAYKSKSKGLEVTLGAGIKLPAPPKRYYKDDASLPEDVLPSTGAFGWMGLAIIQKVFKPQKITLILYNRYEQNFVNDNEYKYGDRLRVSLIASKKIKSKISLIVQTRYEYIAQDEPNGKKDMNTGANLIFVSPQILYSLKSKWNFVFAVDLPVYKNYKGTQMSNNYALNLSLTHDLNLRKKAEQ